ncbi:MAG TPA: DUF4845 domain-containing protein [Gammaproteobacteria bacterium]
MNNLYRRQRGMTFLGWLIVLGILGFFVLLALKLTPVYLEYMRVAGQMDSLVEEPNIGSMAPVEIKKLLLRRFSIDDVTNVKPDQIKIERNSEQVTINVAYQVQTPMVGNIDALVKFDKTLKVRTTNN